MEIIIRVSDNQEEITDKVREIEIIIIQPESVITDQLPTKKNLKEELRSWKVLCLIVPPEEVWTDLMKWLTTSKSM